MVNIFTAMSDSKKLTDPREQYAFLSQALEAYRNEQEQDLTLEEFESEEILINSMNNEEYRQYQIECEELSERRQVAELECMQEVQRLYMLGANAPMPKKLKLSEFIEEYCEKMNAHKPTTLKNKREAMQAVIKHFGDITLIEIDAKGAHDFMADKLAHRTRSYVKTLRQAIKSIFDKAKEWGYINANPFATTPAIIVPDDDRQKHMTPEEFERLLAVIPESKRLYADIVKLLWHTGIRSGELRQLRWEQVNETRRELTLFNTKNHKKRIVPLNDSAFAIIYRQRETMNGEYVFPGRHGARSRSNIGHEIKRYLRAAGLPESLHAHSTRHSAITCLANSGTPLYMVKEMFGLSSVSVLEKHYVHATSEDNHKAMKALDVLGSSNRQSDTNIYPLQASEGKVLAHAV